MILNNPAGRVFQADDSFVPSPDFDAATLPELEIAVERAAAAARMGVRRLMANHLFISPKQPLYHVPRPDEGDVQENNAGKHHCHYDAKPYAAPCGY